MATRSLPASSASEPADVRQRGMVCWIFYRENRALSCSLSVDGDESGVHVTRLWDDESFSEFFTRPEDALQRHAEIASFLHDSGWLLADRLLAPAAA